MTSMTTAPRAVAGAVLLSGAAATVAFDLFAQPTREFARVDQIGALAAFLCSEAAAQITGAALPVDGGWTAQ